MRFRENKQMYELARAQELSKIMDYKSESKQTKALFSYFFLFPYKWTAKHTGLVSSFLLVALFRATFTLIIWLPLVISFIPNNPGVSLIWIEVSVINEALSFANVIPITSWCVALALSIIEGIRKKRGK